MQPGEKPLSSKEAARILRRTDEWLLLQRQKKKGPPYYRIGGRIEYYESEIREWIASCRVTAA